MEKKFFQMSVDDSIRHLESDINHGLQTEVVRSRLETNGTNQLKEGKKRPLILKFIDQLVDFMILILAIAAGISMLHGEYAEGGLIFAIILLNALLGLFQEAKAEKALESIKNLSSPHVTVIRDGKESVVDVKEIVVGDIVLLEAGDYVPADVRLIESINLKIDESALTGEAVPVEKNIALIEADDTPLGDRINLGFMSTVVTYGRGKAIVIATGMDTEIGKIAEMLSAADVVVTPLQKSINQLGKILAVIALIITAIIFVIQLSSVYIQTGSISSESVSKAFLGAVALAVAAIPEGLPAIITIVLSLGMQNLVKQRAIMRTLPAVETLGSTSIICSDKTGTLTQNVMTVQKVYVSNQEISLNQIDLNNKSTLKLVDYGVLVNDTKVQLENNHFVKIGDPTEIAFIDLAIAVKKNPITIKQETPRIYELPFDSERKLMTTVHDIGDKRYAIIKGAPDVLFQRSTSIEINDTIEAFDSKALKTLSDANNHMSDQALRVLAVGYKEIDKKVALNTLSFDELEYDVTLLGLVGMIDPPRPEAKDAIALCNVAGIKTIMITGDHKNTAVAIAKELNILTADDIAITGKDLDNMTDSEFAEKLEHIRVYARVSPENKVRIVKAWRETGKIIAMTGDGVNDAPSIKQADIGIAMGITGTEVAKGAADMVLTDDNFATIVGAVGEGRAIFANIKKAIHFLLSCNIGEIVTIFLGIVVGTFLFDLSDGTVTGGLVILTAAQILWVNLVTDSLMAIALGLEPKEPNVMEQQPRDAKKSLFADGLGKRIAWQGIMLGVLSFIAFTIGWYYEDLFTNNTVITAHTRLQHAQTMTFMVLALSQLVHAFNARSEIFSTFKLAKNKSMFYAFFVSLALQLMVVTIPWTRETLFGIDNIWQEPIQIVIIIGLILIPLVVVEIQKAIVRKRNLVK